MKGKLNGTQISGDGKLNGTQILGDVVSSVIFFFRPHEPTCLKDFYSFLSSLCLKRKNFDFEAMFSWILLGEVQGKVRIWTKFEEKNLNILLRNLEQIVLPHNVSTFLYCLRITLAKERELKPDILSLIQCAPSGGEFSPQLES